MVGVELSVKGHSPYAFCGEVQAGEFRRAVHAEAERGCIERGVEADGAFGTDRASPHPRGAKLGAMSKEGGR